MEQGTPYRFAALATYNGEQARGLVHTAVYQRRMAAEQALFDAERKAELIAKGFEETKPGSAIWFKAADPSPRWRSLWAWWR